ncbi:MAG TPA: hypothetical protein VMS93_09705 [Candidatus Saccharimonadales bacterium]|nr:hypothetical protein [Candidatus Saccharimonadales bacterium]
MNVRTSGIVGSVVVLAFLSGFGVASFARESHPLLHKPQKQLQNAKGTFEHAAQDFGGHRVKAIQHIDEALDELHQALAFDKNQDPLGARRPGRGAAGPLVPSAGARRRGPGGAPGASGAEGMRFWAQDSFAPPPVLPSCA